MSEHETSTANVPAVAPIPKPPLEIGQRVYGIIPRNIDEVARIAKAIITAGLAPDSYRGRTDEETASRVIVGIMKGAEVGFPPITALSTIAIINGRPSIYGDGAIALAQSHGLVSNFEHRYDGDDESGEDYTCHVLIYRKGQDAPYEGRFSVKDAMRAKLWNNPRKQPWIEYPKRMLFNRARAFALRDGFADVLCGLSIAEEAQDMPEAPKAVSKDFLNDDAPKQVENKVEAVAAE